MRKIRDLDPTELRVLGALLEKEQATPDYYPLTLSALVAACNQKSNREPVTELGEGDVVTALDSLRQDTLVWRSEGARSERWSQSITRRLELEGGEKAVLTLLLLRGPQTPGELRGRSERLHAFADTAEVERTLRGLAVENRELVAELARRPGQKESRWAHLLGGEPEEAAALPAAASGDSLAERVARLERRIEELGEQVAALAAGLPTPRDRA